MCKVNEISRFEGFFNKGLVFHCGFPSSLGEVRFPLRPIPRVLSGELAVSDPQAGVHHLHHGGPVLAAAGRHALPLHAYRHRTVDPQEDWRLFSTQHHEPQGD